MLTADCFWKDALCNTAASGFYEFAIYLTGRFSYYNINKNY